MTLEVKIVFHADGSTSVIHSSDDKETGRKEFPPPCPKRLLFFKKQAAVAVLEDGVKKREGGKV